MSDQTVVIRDARDADIAGIHAIYSFEVLNGVASFEEMPPTEDELLQRRAQILALGLPYLVAQQNGRIVGFCSAGSYRTRPAYRHTIENTVYVANGLYGQGIGRALMDRLILRCEQGHWRQMVAVIGDSQNAGSVALHTSLGFRKVGVLRNIGFKHERWLDSVIMQRALRSAHDQYEKES